MLKKVLMLFVILSIVMGVEAKIIVVDTSGTSVYQTIQAGVAVADTGDTVFVKKGHYYDAMATLNIPISLIGEDMDSVIVEAPFHNGILAIRSPNCVIRFITFSMPSDREGGIFCESASPFISYNNFEGVGVGILCGPDASPIIEYNNFYIPRPGGWCIDLTGDTLSVDARYNYWNTTNESEIQEMIFDSLDDSNLGIVNYTPWLDTPVGISEKSPQFHKIFFLGQNLPNPFKGSTTIAYQLAGENPARVQLKIYNTTGELIKVLVDGIQKPGVHTVNWKGTDQNGGMVPRGVYFCRLKTKEYKSTKKMVRLK